jgi:outer membrane protein
MKFSALSRTGFAVALSAVIASLATPARAESVDSIFAKVSPSVRDRMFFRLDYVYANVKTTSGNAYDVTGPVLTQSDIPTYLAPGNAAGYVSPYFKNINKAYGPVGGGLSLYYQLFGNAGLDAPGAVAQDVAAGFASEAKGLGTPEGIKAKSDESVSTLALSVGYFLTDDFTWFVEGLVLGAPLKVNVKGDGVNGSGVPNGINGVNILQTKLLPPTAILGYYFGAANDAFRPFAGLGGSYALFFDSRATDALNAYQGGANSGDTTVSIKNAFGFGPFLGFRTAITNDWHVNLGIGKLRYKTEATLVTRNTKITSNSAVLRDYGPFVATANTDGADVLKGQLKDPSVGVVSALMCDLAAAKYHNNNCNLGTYERKQSTVLDNTMFMFSVGRSF